MRNDVLQNYLDQFLKCLAENLDNQKFQDASKVVIILHCGPKLYMYQQKMQYHYNAGCNYLVTSFEILRVTLTQKIITCRVLKIHQWF